MSDVTSGSLNAVVKISGFNVFAVHNCVCISAIPAYLIYGIISCNQSRKRACSEQMLSTHGTIMHKYNLTDSGVMNQDRENEGRRENGNGEDSVKLLFRDFKRNTKTTPSPDNSAYGLCTRMHAQSEGGGTPCFNVCAHPLFLLNGVTSLLGPIFKMVVSLNAIV